jgi:hypothetical protein
MILIGTSGMLGLLLGESIAAEGMLDALRRH